VKKTQQRLWLSAIVIAIIAGGMARAEVIAPKKVAQVAVVSGAAARELLALKPVRPLLLGESQGQAVVAVLTVEADDAPRVLEKLFAKEVAGCNVTGGPELCCAADQSLRVSTRLGWADLGQRCEPEAYAAHQRGDSTPNYPRTSLATMNEDSVAFIDISHDLSAALYEQAGIDYQLSQITTPDGQPRVLVSPLDERADLQRDPTLSPEALLAQIALVEPPRQTLAWHPVKQAECASSFDACRDISTDQKCRRSNGHIYLRASDGRWCRLVPCCSGNCKC
jgi:hypothetical protein